MGSKKPLQFENLGDLPKQEQPEQVFLKFEEEFTKSKNEAPWKIFFALAATHRSSLIVTALLLVIGETVSFLLPFCINGMIYYVQSTQDPIAFPLEGVFKVTGNGYFLSFMVLMTGLISTVAVERFYFIAVKLGLVSKSCLQMFVYKKSLRLSNSSQKQTTIGNIVNLMAIDAEILGGLFQVIHFAWVLPLKALIAMGLLLYFLGWVSILGVVITTLFIFIQSKMMSTVSKIQENISGARDERIKKTNELLQGMKIIKLNSWEKFFLQKIETVRSKELNLILKSRNISNVNTIFGQIIPILITITCFSLYSLVHDQSFTLEQAFTSILLFSQLRDALDVAWIFNGLISAFVSAKRLSQFASAQELDRFGFLGKKENMIKNTSDDVTFRHLLKEVVLVFKGAKKVKEMERVSLMGYEDSDSQIEIEHDIIGHKPPIAKIENGTFCWSLEDEHVTLDHINVEFPIGKLTMITGVVGSGKSSLISALLGEMRQITPKDYSCVQLFGSLAYCSQQPWILNATVRDNITFGKEFQEKKYQQILKDCALLPDLQVLKAGDLTEIGEKGINLSGGQKQRVSLARALYADAEICIFDDPLSALDAHVGRHVFNHCILKLAKQGKTVILVTHQLQYLPFADFLMEIKQGKIHSFFKQQKLVNFEISQENSKEDLLSQTTQESLKPTKNTEMNGKLIDNEERKTGSVAFSIYISYLRVCGIFLSILCVFIIVLSRLTSIGTDWWMSFWSSSAQNPSNPHSTGYFIGGYAAFGVFAAVVLACDYFLISAISFRSSKQLHKLLLETLSRAPISFFDTTPIGRILNRFSSDIRAVDEVLCGYLFSVLRQCALFASTLFIQVYATPLFLIPSIPIFILYFLVQKFFRATAVELKRLSSISRSPVFAHFSESLGGLATIRSYRLEKNFEEKLAKSVSLNMKTNVYVATSNRWLGVALQMMGIVLMFFACVFMSISAKTVPVVLVGLSFTYTLKVTTILNVLVRMHADLETTLNSMERIDHYRAIPSESNTPNSSSSSPNAFLSVQKSNLWPSEGLVVISNLSVRYREELPLVLHQISATISGGERVGICGRTGSGKSSFALALFRMIPFVAGEIRIDDVNISTISLEQLRSAIGIVPQDPTLFQASIRYNLDPTEQFSDEQLWEALKIAQLSQIVSNLPNKLDHEVAEGGQNFSVGQRQLFCIARAFLKKCKILVMDEATASIDPETDIALQQILKTCFQSKTVFIIAHRMATILDCDKIMLLEEGQLKEFDSPKKLLLKSDSLFSKLVEQSKLNKVQV